MGVPTKYRMAKDASKSCATCAYFNKLMSSCNKFITYVDPGAVCDAWSMGTKQAEAVIRRATRFIKRGANPVGMISRVLPAFDAVNLTQKPEGLTAADATGKAWSGATAIEQGARGLRYAGNTIPTLSGVANKASPFLTKAMTTAGRAGTRLGVAGTAIDAGNTLFVDPRTGQFNNNIGQNLAANKEQSMANVKGYGGGARNTAKAMASSAFTGWGSPVKTTSAAMGGLYDISRERIDRLNAERERPAQEEAFKQKRYEVARNKAYANAPSEQNVEAQIAQLKAKRQPAQQPMQPQQMLAKQAPKPQTSTPVAQPQPPKPQVAQAPKPQTPVKTAQHTRACECGRVSDTYYDICPVCQPKLDAKAAVHLNIKAALRRLEARHGKSIDEILKAAVAPTAKQVDAAAAKADKTPTEDQKESGNYKKGHIKMHGLDITIENPKGSTRSGESKAGKKWSTKMTAHYGYIKKTESEADGDHVDVFIGPDPKSWLVYVIDQVNPKTRAFDEHKCILGCKTEAEARKLYLSNYERGWRGLGAVKFMIIPQFKRWLTDGDTGKPVAKQAALSRDPAPASPASASITPTPTNVIPQSSEIVDANSQSKDQAFQTPPVDPNKTLPPVKPPSLKPMKGPAKSLTTGK